MTPAGAAGLPHDPAEATDADLLAAHVAGDPAAFGRLFQRHQDRMWAVALRTMGNREDAADALQDACVAAFRGAAGFRGEAAVTSWLHRIVVNACLDRLRRMKVRAAESLPDDPDSAAPIGATVERDPIADRETHDLVVAALGRIHPDQRAALVLVDIEGYSVQQAATMLGCAPGTVKSRCARGRAKLLPLLIALRSGGADV